MNESLREHLILLASFSWYTNYFKLSDFLYLSQLLKKGSSFNSLIDHISNPKLKESIQSWSRDGFSLFKKELNWSFREGIHITFFGDHDYPYSLMTEINPPIILLYKGAPCWKQRESLSVVGSRNPSSYSLRWMDEYFIEALKKRNALLVVSGAAHGIDQKAHSVSLRARLPTLSFLPSGFKHIYPESFAEWEKPIIEAGGAIVSTFSPFQKVFKASFHKRNQWIAAFSKLLFVVEAGRRSGSMLTARMALERGKSICTLPFSPVFEKGQGSLDLIFDGAHMLRDEHDLIALMDQCIFANFKEFIKKETHS